MKKLIDFNKAEEIQELANKRYGGNFSLAVNSVMSLALDSDDFCNNVDKSKQLISGEQLGYEDAVEFANYIQSDHAKLAKLPERLLDAALAGVDASLFNERINRMLSCDSVESIRIASKVIYDAPPITNNCRYIKTAAELASAFMSYKGNDRKTYKSESHYHNNIINNFSAYFPNYDFVDNEVVTSDGADRIDILARCKKTGGDVIIELKVGNKSAHKQLRSYAYDFEKPILINISEDEVRNKREGITYLTYSDIGASLD